MVSPLEKFDQENEARWEVLNDVPEWEKERVLNWIEGATHERGHDRYGNPTSKYHSSLMLTIQRKERIIFADLGVDISNWYSLKTSLEELLSNNVERLILVLETLVKYVRDNADSSNQVSFFQSKIGKDRALYFLDNILKNGSKWRVVHTSKARAGLEERASEELTDVAKKLVNNDLTEAWNYAFGRETDPKLAIEKAQNAIEYFATKKGLTKASSSVYGVLLGDVKANPKKYESAAVQQFADQDNTLHTENPDGTLNDMMADWFWQTMNLIQKTNVIRHKTSDNDGYVIPIEAARQAVLMATLICEFIENEYFKKGNHRPLKKEDSSKTN